MVPQNYMIKILENYFDAFNNHDVVALKKFFSEKIILEDWNISENGIENVLKANQLIFESAPKIKVNVNDIIVGKSKVIAEIDVIVDETTTLEVVDVFKIQKGLITSIKAYKK